MSTNWSGLLHIIILQTNHLGRYVRRSLVNMSIKCQIHWWINQAGYAVIWMCYQSTVTRLMCLIFQNKYDIQILQTLFAMIYLHSVAMNILRHWQTQSISLFSIKYPFHQQLHQHSEECLIILFIALLVIQQQTMHIINMLRCQHGHPYHFQPMHPHLPQRIRHQTTQRISFHCTNSCTIYYTNIFFDKISNQNQFIIMIKHWCSIGYYSFDRTS